MLRICIHIFRKETGELNILVLKNKISLLYFVSRHINYLRVILKKESIIINKSNIINLLTNFLLHKITNLN